MLGDTPKDTWADGSAYEPYVGRWSRLVARNFLEWLAVPPDSRWLDVGCGTGALTETILASMKPTKVVGIDPAEGYIAYAQAHITDPRARFKVGRAESLPETDASFDATVSGLVLNFVPDPQKAVAEMARATRPGGRVGLYVWDYVDKMELMRYFWDAAVALNPAAADLDEGRRFPICQPKPLQLTLQQAGLNNIETRAIDVPTVFRNFDDYWSPFLGGQAPAPGYAMSLSEENRSRLRDTIRERLPIEPDGSIHLIARAWAVKGER